MSSGDQVLAECVVCGHTTAPDAVCLGCQPFPLVTRCDSCKIRGPRPTDIEPPDIAVPPMPEVVTTESVGADDLPEYRLPKVDVTEIYGQRVEDLDGVLCVVMRDAGGNDCFRMPLPSTFTRGDAMTIAEMHQRGLAQQVAAKRIARLVRGQS